MKTILSTIAALALCTACNEIGGMGHTDIDEWGKQPQNYEAQTYQFNHPCMLHTAADIAFAKAHLTQSPWAEAYDKLKTSGYSYTNYTASPVKYLARLDNNNWGDGGGRWDQAGLRDEYYPGIANNYTAFFKDAAAAYQLALRYNLEGDATCAQTAAKILTDWANTNHGLLLSQKDFGSVKRGGVIDPNEYLILFQIHQVANAAELLRGWNGWDTTADFKQVQTWLRDSFYPFCHQFLQDQGGMHSWMNWDMASLTAMLSIAILCDDNDMANEAILYFKQGKGPGCIMGQGVVEVFEDPDGFGTLAQGNESGRDQGHNCLCACMLGAFCQMAYGLGEDLFAFENHRALDFAAYVAKYNRVKPEKIGAGNLKDGDFAYPESALPFKEYFYCDQTMTKISADGRGDNRPGWDLWHAAAQRLGVQDKYVGEMAAQYRPDGGGGHYGPNSGGFDQLGFSTLMYFKN